MSVYMKVTAGGRVSITSGPLKTRLEDLNKWLARNPDAIFVRLKDRPGENTKYKVGHLCRIEESDDGQNYNVFVGKNYLGQLPDEALSFAKKIDYEPEILISIVGKIEHDEESNSNIVSIYIAE